MQSRLSLTTSATLFLAGLGAAQPELAAIGGSVPGTLSLAFGPHQPFVPALIILSISPGPIPLSLIDPRDSRVLCVGVESIGVAFSGLTAIDGFLRPPPIPIPANAGFVNQTLFFQGLTLDGLAGVNNIVGQVSTGRVVRFGAAGTFKARGVQMAQSRAFFQPILLPDGRCLAAGGGSGALLAQVARDTSEIYDPKTDRFVAGPMLTTPRSVHTVTELQDGRWLLAGGVDGNNDPQIATEVGDAAGTRFTASGNMASPRMGHTATRLADGRVLVCGGLSDLNGSTLDPILSALRTTEIYDPATGTWSNGPNMSRPRAGHGAIPLPNGEILIAGGVGFQVIIIPIPAIWTQCEIYDPTSNSFRNASSMGTGRAIFSVAELAPGRFLAAGGISSLLGLGTPTANAEFYDASSGSWTATGSMARARGMSGVFDLGGGRFLHYGGGDGTLLNPNALASSEIYDVSTGAFTAGPSLTQSRAAFGAFLAPTGQLHIIGGGTGQNAAATTTDEWYDR